MTPTMTFECPRCSGYKHFARFAHVADGVCFQCGGTGVVDRLPVRRPSEDLTNRPYTVVYPDSEVVCSTYKTWEDAASALKRSRDSGGRIAKYNASAGRYLFRDQSPVGFLVA